MAAHFDRDDIALPGFREFFKKQSDEEREHAQKFIEYQNKRGGRVTLSNLEKPPTEWPSPLAALEAALGLEKIVNDKLLKLHKTAGEAEDPHLADFLEEHFLEEQVEAIKKLADLITILKRCGEGLGVYLFDKDLKS
jgi:ferritin heavy chain